MLKRSPSPGENRDHRVTTIVYEKKKETIGVPRQYCPRLPRRLSKRAWQRARRRARCTRAAKLPSELFGTRAAGRRRGVFIIPARRAFPVPQQRIGGRASRQQQPPKKYPLAAATPSVTIKRTSQPGLARTPGLSLARWGPASTRGETLSPHVTGRHNGKLRAVEAARFGTGRALLKHIPLCFSFSRPTYRPRMLRVSNIRADSDYIMPWFFPGI